MSCGGSAQNDAGCLQISPNEANRIIKEDAVLIVDVRTPAEVEDGMIDGAIHMDLRADDFSDRITSLKRDERYIVYCQSGKRSMKACMIMSEMGFTDVRSVDGGYEDLK